MSKHASSTAYAGDAKFVADVSHWAEWSLTPHTEDEIREKVLTDYNNVCFTYVCCNSDMSADFIEEFMALSTGLLTKENYDEYYADVLKGVLINLNIEEGSVYDLNIPIIMYRDHTGQLKRKEGIDRLYNRLDWSALSQKKNLPIWFKLKYAKLLNIKMDGLKDIKE